MKGLQEIVQANNPPSDHPESVESLKQRVNQASAEFSAAEDNTREPHLRSIIQPIISALQGARFRLFGG